MHQPYFRLLSVFGSLQQLNQTNTILMFNEKTKYSNIFLGLPM